VKVNFSTDGESVYANSEKQISGETVVDFSKGTVQYSVVAKSGKTENYWITILKPEADAKLFVNGPKEREVYLDNRYNMRHDIFIANIGGDKPLTGLKVSLNAENVALDDYWTVGGEKNDTLAAFTESSNIYTDGDSSYTGGMNNFAKIRLVTGGKEGVISGTLTISADGVEPQVITLHGWAGNPRITTESVSDGVKYVPYSALIQNSIHVDNMTAEYSLITGELPHGMELRRNGELYGVPRQSGEFPITVEAQFLIDGNNNYTFEADTVDLILKITENTDENVAAAVDEGYTLAVKVPALMNQYKERVFRSEGAFNEFVDFYLDGDKLVEGVDYNGEEGSTIITILAQTFEAYGEGTHTIAAEFRTNQNTENELKRAAQNYTIDLNAVISEPDNPSNPDRPSNPDSPSNPVNPNSPSDSNDSGNGGNSADSNSTSNGEGTASGVEVKLFQPITSTSEITGFYGYPRWLLNEAVGLTTEEKEAGIYVETNIANSACGPLAKKALEDMAKLLNAKISHILDITVTKYAKNGAPIEELTTLKNKIRISLIAPPGVDAATHDFAILRLHESKVELLFDIDNLEDRITFESDQFSEYAIIYADRGFFSALSKEVRKSPATGDIVEYGFLSRYASVFVFLLIMSICVQVTLLIRERK
jgi:hypothetical protein